MPNARVIAGAIALLTVAGACTAAPTRTTGAVATATPGTAVSDTATRSGAVTGSMRQDAASIRLQFRGVLVRLMPLDTFVTQLLAADTRRAMTDLLSSQRAGIDRARQVHGEERLSAWYVTYYALEPDSRFSPSEVVVQSLGRTFQPVEILPLSAGFSEHRLQQGQSQSALYLFEAGLDVSQPLEVVVEGVRSDEWTTILRLLERERARVRSTRTDTLSQRH